MRVESQRLECFKAGELREGYEYRYFVPGFVNCDWTWSSKHITMALDEASSALGRLDSLAQFVPDIDLFIRMHVVREASASSKIEGTQTSFEDAVKPEQMIADEFRDDWREVNNYTEAMNESVCMLSELPMSMRLLRAAHRRLMEGVRGKNKLPGEFRTSQNWIGGYSIATAAYVPPSADLLPGLLGDLETFWHNEKVMVPDLVRCAISHYQFETIHPFLDGNGRVGRLMIPLYLIAKGKLHFPALYISGFFEDKRKTYYECFTRVRERNSLEEWVLFFLEGIRETCDAGCATFRDVFSLRDEMRNYCIGKRGRGELFGRIIAHLYSNPVVQTKTLAEEIGTDYYTANTAIKTLVEDGVLEAANGFKRNRVFVFKRYMDIFSRRR